MNIKPYFILFTALCLSCSSSTEKEEQALRKGIMDTHDALIPKIDNLRSLKEALQANKDYLNRDSLSATAQGITPVSLDSLILALTEADSSLMTWMKEYNDFNETSFTHEQQMEYLREEKDEIEALELKVLSSIVEAQHVLGEETTAP